MQWFIVVAHSLRIIEPDSTSVSSPILSMYPLCLSLSHPTHAHIENISLVPLSLKLWLFNVRCPTNTQYFDCQSLQRTANRCAHCFDIALLNNWAASERAIALLHKSMIIENNFDRQTGVHSTFVLQFGQTRRSWCAVSAVRKCVLGTKAAHSKWNFCQQRPTSVSFLDIKRDLVFYISFFHLN